VQVSIIIRLFTKIIGCL